MELSETRESSSKAVDRNPALQQLGDRLQNHQVPEGKLSLDPATASYPGSRRDDLLPDQVVNHRHTHARKLGCLGWRKGVDDLCCGTGHEASALRNIYSLALDY